MTSSARPVPIRTSYTPFSLHSYRLSRILIASLACICIIYICSIIYINTIGSQIKQMEIANNKMEQEITQKQGDIFTLSNNTEFIESKSIQLSLTEPTDSDIHYMSIPDTAFVMR